VLKDTRTAIFCNRVVRGYDFFGGTFFPAFRAFESPMAMACFLLFTFLPLRPDLSWPFFIAFISVSTLFPAAGEYFLPKDFFALMLFRVVAFLAEVLFLEEPLFFALLFFALLDFFFVAFLIAIYILLRIRCSSDSSQYCNCSSTLKYELAAESNHATQPVSSRANVQEDRLSTNTQCMRVHP
jgi:hypothetical protein